MRKCDDDNSMNIFFLPIRTRETHIIITMLNLNENRMYFHAIYADYDDADDYAAKSKPESAIADDC